MRVTFKKGSDVSVEPCEPGEPGHSLRDQKEDNQEGRRFCPVQQLSELDVKGIDGALAQIANFCGGRSPRELA